MHHRRGCHVVLPQLPLRVFKHDGQERGQQVGKASIVPLSFTTSANWLTYTVDVQDIALTAQYAPPKCRSTPLMPKGAHFQDHGS